ncbi:hypothetical protein LQK89_16860 (plasmid) [Curtobacterium sp. C1]|jgi:hypothetical protein|uniref:hypothetical protein n=1 Tax=Curtobacterium sp. C1 TaxID=2898151 RepID=UPI001E4E999A|nr:hypothetical protein [Curtobacterium sp. C1]UFU15948.1 hypothetical protein LQK89_16860 [Curtobacterium sp. C1]
MTGRDDIYATVTTILPAGEDEQLRSRVLDLNLWAKEGWRLRDSIHIPLGDVIEVHDTLERTGPTR